MDEKGIIFDIQQFSTHDGPGIRTTVFFKGCNNRCLWCHNPESLSIKPQIQFFANKCIGCGKCAEVCTHGVFLPNGKIDSSKCVACGLCADNCCAKARVMCGKEMTSEEVLKIILKDKSFYQNSNGGVTLSGGEPLLQIDFATEIARKCFENGINICIQTAGNVSFDYFEKIIPYTSYIMFDFKVFNKDIHKKYVGVNNNLILDNLNKLSEISTIKLIVRTPIVTGVNDNEAEISSICDYIKDYKNLQYYELLKYHNLGRSKLENLNMDFGCEFEVPKEEKMLLLKNIAETKISNVKYI